MAGISMRTFCETVYCAYARAAVLTVGADERIAFWARVTNLGGTAEHYLEFDAVHALTRHRDVPALERPDDMLELSVVELEREPHGWRVWLNPWYLEVIEFRCARIRLDGAEVIGEGRWLQDDLPSARSV